MKQPMGGALDMTTGGIPKMLVRFALPIMLGQLLQELYSVVDMLIVGRTLGTEKLAAIGATGAAVFLVTGFTSGLSYGCSVLTAQRFGADDERGIRESVAAHMLIAAVFAVVLTTAFVLLSGPLLRLLRTTEDIYPYARLYVTIIYAGLPATVLYTLLASLLRAVGDSRTPLLFLILSSLLNIGLDFLFILVMKWDVAGAAIATVAAQLLSGLLCFVVIRRRAAFLLPGRESWHGIWRAAREELKVGVPMAFQFSVTAIGLMVLQAVLNGFGADAVAAYTVSSRVQNLMFCPLGALSAVMATFVAQNVGAGRIDRVRTGVRQSMLTAIGISVLIALVFWLLRGPIVQLFVGSGNDNVVTLGKKTMDWCCPLLWTLGMLFVYRGALQGLGDGVTTLLGGLMELLMRTAIPLLLSGVLGFTAICIAGPAAWVGCAALLLTVYYVRLHQREVSPIT